ncbi:GyrI-like domain-containing protein [Burkholderia cepacia]|uniref:AraC family transcriptional regulator n=1 Tax=Burkholderia cepacia GG4 TaxID=1009846 RepID=A0A9W3K7G1_BURCE|nr:GyrI-like domain-containing protein [Burkholderia cepacia]AFQ51769.1 AraC family transcriptional regulator [Burkholderia cepacia GG4]
MTRFGFSRLFSMNTGWPVMRYVRYSIWNGWLPTSGFKAVDAPEFERYSGDYDPVTGAGELEIWLPVEHSA